jgi:hypothetical protein
MALPRWVKQFAPERRLSGDLQGDFRVTSNLQFAIFALIQSPAGNRFRYTGAGVAV